MVIRMLKPSWFSLMPCWLFGARGSVVVMAQCYKPGGRGFEIHLIWHGDWTFGCRESTREATNHAATRYFPSILWKTKVIAAFTTALSWARPVQSTPYAMQAGKLCIRWNCTRYDDEIISLRLHALCARSRQVRDWVCACLTGRPPLSVQTSHGTCWSYARNSDSIQISCPITTFCYWPP
jgi:hypothetical protein